MGLLRTIRGASGNTPTRPAKPHRPTKNKAGSAIARPADERFNLHGEEGADGSSPSEGTKTPAKRTIFVVRTARIEHLLEKEGSETTSDVRQHVLELA
jgi:hypothetical protein